LHLCLTCRGLVSNAPSGLVRATGDLAESLAAAGHQVELLTDLAAGPAPALPGVSIRRLPVVPLALGAPPSGTSPDTALDNLTHAAALYREVRRIHERERPVDAVLAPLWGSLGSLCVLDERFPTIVSCMTSLSTLAEIDRGYRALPDIDERLRLEHEALRRSTYLHGLTQSALDKTIADHDLHPLETAVVNRAVRDHWSGERSHRRSGTEILFVGRIEQRKGLDTLLAAARELVDAELDVRFTVVGPEADRNVLEPFLIDAATRPRLREVTEFTGPISDERLWALYERADIVCLPSRYESHGIAVVEAMMFAKPILTSGRGGLAEIVVPEQTALLAAADDGASVAQQLRRLINQPELGRRLGSAARRVYEDRFGPQVVGRQMLTFIDHVVAKHAGGSEGHDVQPKLERLLRDVLRSDAATAASLATELLDPVAHGSLRRISESARAAPPRSNGTNHPRVTAVVLTQNRPELLRGALDSLAGASVQTDVIVIDDASTPEAARRVVAECAGRPRVRLHRSDHPQGCAAGRRLGVELAEGELILFLDDDAELMPGALEHLCAELEAHPHADAVTATVVSSNGQVLHSGGSVNVRDGVATYALIGADAPFADNRLPPSGTVAWVPGTAALIRREVLEEFPMDAGMVGYYEDNEWSYRVRAQRDGEFRRSREALVLHHLVPKRFDWADPQARSRWAAWLASHARFYEQHGVLVAPWFFDLFPEMRADDGSCDYAGARLLLELTIAKGAEWVVRARGDGELDDLLNARRNRIDRAELASLRAAVGPGGQTLAFLRRRHEALSAIEQGGWWRLRARILPLLRAASKLRGWHKHTG
jgi:glycosyltransferase involved in cell wall biosynthesis/GT2 family glycosyltransferase